MARKTVIVSDISGQEVQDGQGARVTITYSDARRGVVVLDVTAEEVEELATKGQRQGRRGKRPRVEA